MAQKEEIDREGWVCTERMWLRRKKQRVRERVGSAQSDVAQKEEIERESEGWVCTERMWLRRKK